MRLHRMLVVSFAAVLAGCATVVHGPYQDVRIESVPPGASATVSPMLSSRGPNFLDEQKVEVTTPATVRLRRDNTYRVELLKQGYKVAFTQVDSSYDWLWSPVGCGPCEAVAELPSADVKDRALPIQFANALYEYPKGFVRALGYTLRLFSPDALLGNSFKLKPEGSGYFGGWHGLGTPTVTKRLDPLD